MKETQEKIHDVAVVGGGPAGLTAALFLARYLHSVVVVDSGDPRNWEARGIHGYLGLHGVEPSELRRRGRDEGRAHGVEFVDDTVETVRQVEDECFRLVLGTGGEVLGRRLLLAIGIKDYWPEVPGLKQCYGETAHHCPDCDGYEARGKKTVVIAWGRKAVGMALNLATWTRQLVICTNGQPPDVTDDQLARLDALNIPVLPDAIVRLISEEGQARALELANGMMLDCERIFFAIGHYPADDLGVQLGCDRDDEELIVVDDAQHTSVPNVFAAGDITPGPHLALKAARDGAVAALSIHKSLLPDALRLDSGLGTRGSGLGTRHSAPPPPECRVPSAECRARLPCAPAGGGRAGDRRHPSGSSGGAGRCAA